ncbi:pentapeptide repeat-containing protein [Streptomyces sp. NPDC057950]|uniref:pentapeptide repeat-containing protein n=1 Tax=Streptomyces sp. NPDC057950 TaxID=3346288 RepID=UPI0036E243EE
MPPRPIRSSSRYRPWISLVCAISCDRPRRCSPRPPLARPVWRVICRLCTAPGASRGRATPCAAHPWGRAPPAKTCGNAARFGARATRPPGHLGGRQGRSAVRHVGVRRRLGVRRPHHAPCQHDARRADARRADMCGADMCGADMCGADMCGADVRRADVRFGRPAGPVRPACLALVDAPRVPASVRSRAERSGPVRGDAGRGCQNRRHDAVRLLLRR